MIIRLLYIDIEHNPVQHEQTKHMEIDQHFIKEKLEDEVLDLPFVKSKNQLADILTFTKTVSIEECSTTLDNLDIRNICAPNWIKRFVS